MKLVLILDTCEISEVVMGENVTFSGRLIFDPGMSNSSDLKKNSHVRPRCYTVLYYIGFENDGLRPYWFHAFDYLIDMTGAPCGEGDAHTSRAPGEIDCI